METIKNIGLIKCGTTSNKSFHVNYTSRLQGYHIKKAFVQDKASEGFLKSVHPQVEMVQDKESIMKDGSIDLFIVSGPADQNMGIIKELLQTGKNVQVL